MTDHEVLQQIKEDNPRVITQVYKKYHDEFIRFVRSGFPELSIDNAEDAYSECFQALNRNVKNGKLVALSCNLKTYLFQIGKYKVIDELNRKLRAGNSERIVYIPPDEILNLDYFEEKDAQLRQSRLLDETIAWLTDKCRTLIKLFWYDQKRDAEIVALMNYQDTKTVKNQRSRCMKALKTEYLDRLVDEKIITQEKRDQLLGK